MLAQKDGGLASHSQFQCLPWNYDAPARCQTSCLALHRPYRIPLAEPTQVLQHTWAVPQDPLTCSAVSLAHVPCHPVSFPLKAGLLPGSWWLPMWSPDF